MCECGCFTSPTLRKTRRRDQTNNQLYTVRSECPRFAQTRSKSTAASITCCSSSRRSSISRRFGWFWVWIFVCYMYRPIVVTELSYGRRIEVRAVRRSRFCVSEIWSLSTNECNILTSAVRRCRVLLQNGYISGNSSNCREKLLSAELLCNGHNL